MKNKLLECILKNRTCFRIIQWTWGFPQTMSGALLYLRYYHQPHMEYHGSVVTIWPHESSMSLGMYIFLSDKNRYQMKKGKITVHDHSKTMRLLMHEYGHSIQSILCGPFYMIAVGLPSAMWNKLPAFHRTRKKKNISYFSVYPEKQADKLGTRYLWKESS